MKPLLQAYFYGDNGSGKRQKRLQASAADKSAKKEQGKSACRRLRVVPDLWDSPSPSHAEHWWGRLLPVDRALHHRPKKVWESKNFKLEPKQSFLPLNPLRFL
jgi:hypothetical protein